MNKENGWGLFWVFGLFVKGVEDIAIECGDDRLAARRVGQVVVGRSRAFVGGVAFPGIGSERFFPLCTLGEVGHLIMHLFGDGAEKRRVALLRFGVWLLVGVHDHIRMGATVAGSIDDLLVLGYGSSYGSNRSIKENLCHGCYKW